MNVREFTKIAWFISASMHKFKYIYAHSLQMCVCVYNVECKLKIEKNNLSIGP